MRRCDKCGKPIPRYDNIEILFRGKFADKVTKLTGDDRLDFCSLDCLAAFQMGDLKALKTLEV